MTTNFFPRPPSMKPFTFYTYKENKGCSDMKLIAPFRSLVLLLIPLCLLPPPACAIEEAFCAGLGYNLQSSAGASHDKQQGFKSMGSSPFFEYGTQLTIIWARNPTQNAGRKDYPDLEIYTLEGLGSDGNFHPLNGWLLLKIKKIDPKPAQFTQLAVWAVTDSEEPFGEFVFHKFQDCHFHQTGVPLSATNVVPCSATPFNAPMNPNMFVFTDKKAHGYREFSTLWKVDTAYCNIPKSFRFMVVTNTEKWYTYPKGFPRSRLLGVVGDSKDPKDKGYGALIYTTEWLSPEFYGPASPLLNAPKQLKCSPLNSVLNYKPAWLKTKLQKGAGWSPLGTLKFAEAKFYQRRWFRSGSGSSYQEDKAVVASRAVCKATLVAEQYHTHVPFVGRCTKARVGATGVERIYGDFYSVPQCRPGSGPLKTSGRFYDVVDQRKNDLVTRGCSCPKAPTKKEVVSVRAPSLRDQFIDPQPYSVEGVGCRLMRSDKQYDDLGLCKQSAAGKTASSVRQWHAATILFNVMFLIPISFFMARYKKGQIPNAPLTTIPFIPVRPWYPFHVLLTLFMTCMYLSGMCSVTRELGILGKSRHPHAQFHRKLGYYIIYTFGFLCFSGFLRPINLKCRRVAIYIHVLGGYFVHYGGAVLSILSYQIPASPFAYLGILDAHCTKLFYHYPPTIMSGWLCGDVVFQLYTQSYLIYYERRHLELNLRPTYHFPIILPQRVNNYCLINIDNFKDLERFLHNMYIGYCVYNLVAYIIILTFIYFFTNDANQGFGVMECTHDSQGRFVAGLTNFSEHEEVLKRTAFCDDFF